MSIRIALDNQPEFYTNLDFVTGRVILGLNRAEQVGSIVVKLECESSTALQIPNIHEQHELGMRPGPPPGPPGSIASENHKILYKLQQVFPDEYYASSSNPYGAYPLQPGEHQFPFKFKIPINNACSDQMAMSKIGGLGGVGGIGGGGIFGIGGVRVMDGSKQLFMKHATRTLPPSLTGYPMEAEIRYYIKVTVQRPGFLKENWRYQTGFKFLPIEPPRPTKTTQEAFARRPFTFRPRSSEPQKKRASLFGRKLVAEDSKGDAGTADGADVALAPSFEISARLPHPSVVTCNQPMPLRLIAKKLNNSPEKAYLTSLQIDLLGITEVRAQGLANHKHNRWVVASNTNLSIPLDFAADAAVGAEYVIPNDIWGGCSLPNTVAPSFYACNLSRRYELEVRLGLAWGKPKSSLISKDVQPQTITLPLRFSQLEVYSGITPPPELVEAARTTRPGRATFNVPTPRLPPRRPTAGSMASASAVPQVRPSQPQQQPSSQTVPVQPAHDPLYPPQLGPGQEAPPYDDAPPSYDEAIAENLSGPFEGAQERPAYSGVTNENAPSQMPQEKR